MVVGAEATLMEGSEQGSEQGHSSANDLPLLLSLWLLLYYYLQNHAFPLD